MNSQDLTFARQLLETDPRKRIWYTWLLARSLELDYAVREPKSRANDPSRFDSLLNEAQARIPAHTPEWTDHNDSDPGITLAALFAFLAEFENRIALPRRSPFRRIVCRWLCR